MGGGAGRVHADGGLIQQRHPADDHVPGPVLIESYQPLTTHSLSQRDITFSIISQPITNTTTLDEFLHFGFLLRALWRMTPRAYISPTSSWKASSTPVPFFALVHANGIPSSLAKACACVRECVCRR
jgi:hypothetical protein